MQLLWISNPMSKQPNVARINTRIKCLINKGHGVRKPYASVCIINHESESEPTLGAHLAITSAGCCHSNAAQPVIGISSANALFLDDLAV